MAQPFVAETSFGNRKLIIESGRIAAQAGSAVTLRCGDTVLLVTCCISPQPREGVDFLPLTIEFEERMYAAGKIPGGFLRREGKPSEDAVLSGRLTDRPLRPLLPKTWRREIQVIITVLSTDKVNDPDTLGIIGGSCVLGMSEIPFDGPVGACHVGCIDGQLVVNPPMPDMEKSTLDLVVASTKKAVVMVEAGAKEVPEDMVTAAMKLAHEENQKLIALQEQVIAALGKAKVEAPPPIVSAEVKTEVERLLAGRLWDALNFATKAEREPGLEKLKGELTAALKDQYSEAEINAAFDSAIKYEFRNHVLKEGVRTNNRPLTQIRPLSCEVGLLPRVHGSGLFTRGETQALTITTLGSMRDAQELDNLGLAESKRYIHHYNFPPYSTGEVKRVGVPSRREVGHGALAERALLPVIPSQEEFPYTLRLVSDIMSSSGSTSMAAVCGSTLSLMDAGVPISAPVAGISMGLVTSEDGGEYRVLTDIEGMEDNYGDMDYKVAGTTKGITALQLDIKLKGVSLEILEQAMWQSRDTRLFILETIHNTIAHSRPELSPYAPRMYKIQIDVEKIGTVIGPGGKTIRAITDESGATIDIMPDGLVIIGAVDETSARKAINAIENLTREIKVGEIFTGKVVRIMNFGAFVSLLPGKDGMVHISELENRRVDKVEDVVKIGDEVTVKVIEIDNQGRVNLSRRALLEKGPGDNADDEGSARQQGFRPPMGGGRPPQRRF
ncbi:MAG: polyribonucleotide nucleotidyltransferase [Dehalococcoidia bacterium]|nr:polyribonucleotide nucleotidyltransferase [Dehalococcoidia bacterium]